MKVYHNPHHGVRSGGLGRWTRIPENRPTNKRARPNPVKPEFLRYLSRKEEHRREAAHDPNAFMEYCFTTPESRPFRQGRMHREWNDALGSSNRVMIVAPRLHGKCLAKGTRIQSADGRLVPVEEWSGGAVIALNTETWRFERAWSPPVQPNGVKPVFRLKTRTGRDIIATGNHPFLRLEGWTELSDLSPGDRIAIPNGFSTNGPRMPDGDAWLLGLLVGDGCTIKSVAFSSADPQSVEMVRAIVEPRGWRVVKKKGHNVDWSISWRPGVRSGGPVNWLRKYGLIGCDSRTKRVPVALFAASDLDVAEFLSGYFMADGTVNNRRGATLSLTSASRELLSDVQILLQRLGIASVIGVKNGRYKGKRCSHWRLNIRGRDAWVFCEKVPVRGTKAWRIMESATPPCASPKPGRLHTIPACWRDHLKHSSHWIRETSGLRVDNRYDTIKEKVLSAARVDGNYSLEQLASCDVVWDWVVSVEPAGESETFDIEVPKHHNFIAEGIVTHNTQTVLGRAIYELGQDINSLEKIICQSDTKAVKRLQEVREHITTNNYISEVFPRLHPSRLVEENKHQLRFARDITSKDPSIDVAGITASASGDRATIIIADDVVDRRNAITLPKVREQIKEAWDDWVNLLPPWGRLWYICTLWHFDDLSHKLMSNPAYDVCWYEIDLETFGAFVRLPDGTEYRMDEPLWPPEEGGPWSKDRLAERKMELGTRAFARGFSNRPMSEEEQRVHSDWIVYYEEPPDEDWPMVLSIDTASTTKDTSDWTGVSLAAVHPAIVDTSLPMPASLQGTIKVTKAWHAKINFPDKVKMVKGVARALRRGGYDLDRVVVERAAGGIELADVLADSTGIPLFGITPRHSKTARLERITPYIERGIVQFSQALNPVNPSITDDSGDLIGELLAYPLSSKDIADSFVHLVRFATLAYEGFDGIDRYAEDDDFADMEPGARIMTF